MLSLKKVLCLLCLLPTIVFANPEKTPQEPPVLIKEILKTSNGWDKLPLPNLPSGTPELRLLTFTIKPGAKTVNHVHPLNGVGYVLEGELTMYVTQDTHGSFEDTAQVKKIVLHKGEAWTETVNKWHYGENNGTSDVKFIVVFAGAVGTPPTLSLVH